MHNQMLLELTSLPENVGVARLAVGVFASSLNFSVAELDEIKVAVSEAVTNCVVHAYKQAPGIIQIKAEIIETELQITVSDTGSGIANIAEARAATYSSDPERMGLGFVFMESFMDRLEVNSAVDRGTTIRMSKRCAKQSAA